MAKKKLKIVVGYPPTFSARGIPLLSQNRQFQYFNNPTFLFPVAMGTAATWLKQLGYKTYWKDCIAEGVSEENFFKFLEKEQPDLFIFDTKTPTIKKHWAIAKVLKEKFPKLKLALCGDHPTALPKESMENSPIDFLICGGYHDFATVDLAEALENKTEIPKGIWYRKDGKIVENGRYNLARPLDDAPIIDRVFTHNEWYQKEFNLAGRPLAYIMSGRDCWWGRCTFCFHPDTKITTKNGIVKIKDLKLGEEVLTHNGKYEKNNFIFRRSYSGELINIKADGIKEITKCTPNHKFFAIKNGESKPEFIEASELTEGDFLTSATIEGISLNNVSETLNKQFILVTEDGTQEIQSLIEADLSNKIKIQDNRILFPIKEIKKEEYVGEVYNISVENEHSYNANLMSVSNCVWDHTLYPKGTFRARSPENVMEEVKYLVDEIGVKEIFDDCGTITVGLWLKKFCNLMIESGYNKKVLYSCNMRFGAVSLEEYKLMKEAGFRLLKFGLESGNQETINRLDKGTKIEEVEPSCKYAKEAGLTVHLTIMVGYPWETKEDALRTYHLAKRLMLKGYADVLQSTTVIPYPGTPLNRDAIKNGWFRDDFKYDDYDSYDMAEPVFKSPDMTPEEIQTMCNKIYHIFIDPRYVARKLSQIRSWQDFLYTVKGAKAVFGHLKDFSRPVTELKTTD